MKWQSMDLKTLEREYSPSSMIGGNYQPFLKSYVDLSANAYATCPCTKDLRYGPEPRAMLDFFPAATENAYADLLVFIHGGYWQELSKNESVLLAPAWTNAGQAHCVIGYDLAPQASIAEIIQQCQRALVYLVEQANVLGFNPKKIVLAGSSAGAHIAAMLCLLNHLDANTVDNLKVKVRVPIHAAILLSGIYDLAPIVPTYINAVLGLTHKTAHDVSPLALLSSFQAGTALPALPPLLIAWGQYETNEFKRQSTEFSQKIAAQNNPYIAVEIANRNHFDILNSLGDANSELFTQAKTLFETDTA
jgi:arylformamidase